MVGQIVTTSMVLKFLQSFMHIHQTVKREQYKFVITTVLFSGYTLSKCNQHNKRKKYPLNNMGLSQIKEQGMPYLF